MEKTPTIFLEQKVHRKSLLQISSPLDIAVKNYTSSTKKLNE